MNTVYQFSRSLAAEGIKLKHTPSLWVTLIGGLFVAGLIFIVYLFQVEELNKPDVNPWDTYFQLSFMMVSLLLLTPFVILLAGAIVYPEHQANSRKYLYTLPLPKGYFYYAKLFLLTLLIILTFVLFFCGVVLGGYLLGWIRPVYGFHEYSPRLIDFPIKLGHSFVAALGVAGIQYWLSVRWSNFILPVGAGLLGYIIAMGLTLSGKYDLAVYCPYAYPAIIAQGHEFENSITGLVFYQWLSNVEWYSLLCFLVFTTLGYYEEASREVH